MEHRKGQRVRCIFDESREGVVIESDATRTLIEFEDYEDVTCSLSDGGGHYTHRKWLPARHWRPA